MEVLISIICNMPSWFLDAACARVDPELFHPSQGGTTRPAKKICKGCYIRKQCLTWAIETDQQYGVWGGTSERERGRLRKKYKARLKETS